MKLRPNLAIAFGFFLSFSFPAKAVEPELSDKDLPRVPPTEPGQAVSTFKIKKGFHIELVAAEPAVVDPIAMSFDENGRLFVVEMRDYSERRNETPHLGRIRMLEDTNGDGHFDKSTVFLDNLPWPTAVLCYGGGVFVGATPDIFYCKDTNQDGVADTREVVFTGFASDFAPYETNRLNVQALMNSFNWGLDNRIHGATSMSGGKVIRAKEPGMKPVELRGRDFSFDPRTLEFRAESGGAQHGMSFDSRGRKFVCSNSDHIQLVMYEDRYASQNPFFDMPPPRVSIASDGPAAEVFRISPDEPWRVIRTRWRVTGLASGPIEGGGRPSGYFTGATGTTIYRGDAFPEEYRENAFVADCGSNLVHRKKLFPDGVGLVARRADDEQTTEFLASRDNWFRPVQFANAPDGALYIADMYREVIEHPWSLPESIKAHLDLNSGNDRGRIYRVVPEGFKQPKRPHLSDATIQDLVALLESPNGWHRDTAARLIYERQDHSAVPLLEKLALNSRSPLARMHALYVLDGLRELKQTHLLNALGDADAIVREHAVRLAGELEQGFPGREAQSAGLKLGFNPVAWKKLSEMASDADLRVRYQLAFMLGASKDAAGIKALEEIIGRDAGDRWMRTAVLSALKEGAGEMFKYLIADARFRDSSGGREFLRQLSAVLGTRNDPGEVKMALNVLQKNAGLDIALSLARGMGEGLRNAGSSISDADSGAVLKPLFARAKAMTRDDAAVSEQTRVEAIQLLAMSAFDQAGDALLQMLASSQSESIQLAAVAALAKYHDPGISAAFLTHWPDVGARVRGEMVASMLSRPERIRALITALQERRVQVSDLTAQQMQVLRVHRDPAIRAQAVQLFGATPEKRDDVIKAFLPALQLRGRADSGKRIYQERCATCHRIRGEGFAVGPDLATVKTAGKETLLVNILDPNREVAPGYLSYTLETASGESLSGLIANESPARVTLRGPNGTETVVLRPQIARLQTSGRSLMPEALESGLSLQDMADLIEFLEVAN